MSQNGHRARHATQQVDLTCYQLHSRIVVSENVVMKQEMIPFGLYEVMNV